jgi:hypothetical protein
VLVGALLVVVEELLELPPPHAAPTRTTAVTTAESPKLLLSLTSPSLSLMGSLCSCV